MWLAVCLSIEEICGIDILYVKSVRRHIASIEIDISFVPMAGMLFATDLKMTVKLR